MRITATDSSGLIETIDFPLYVEIQGCVDRRAAWSDSNSLGNFNPAATIPLASCVLPPVSRPIAMGSTEILKQLTLANSLGDASSDGSTTVSVSSIAFPTNAENIQIKGAENLKLVPQAVQAVAAFLGRGLAPGRTYSILWENAIIAGPSGATFPPGAPANVTIQIPPLEEGQIASLLLGSTGTKSLVRSGDATEVQPLNATLDSTSFGLFDTAPACVVLDKDVALVRCQVPHFSLLLPIVLSGPQPGRLSLDDRVIDHVSSRVFSDLVPSAAAGSAMGGCPKDCSGSGVCISAGRCLCFSTHTGYDCSMRICPKHTSWGTGSFEAAEGEECSGRGACDRKSGTCACYRGYEGYACQRMQCPGSLPHQLLSAIAGDSSVVRREAHMTHVRRLEQLRSETPCSGNGVCLTAARLNPDKWAGSWSAERLMACKCSPGYYGSSCELRRCVRGDDPLTACADSDRGFPGAECVGRVHG